MPNTAPPLSPVALIECLQAASLAQRNQVRVLLGLGPLPTLGPVRGAASWWPWPQGGAGVGPAFEPGAVTVATAALLPPAGGPYPEAGAQGGHG